MEIHYIRIPNAKLTEGKTYPFRILKTVSLGPEDDWFVMQDPMGYKILMPKSYYENYGFNKGMLVNCRVDKVNCNGKVFIEPEHPHYKEGKIYFFIVRGTGHHKNILDEDEHYFLVEDAFGSTIKVTTASKSLWDDPPKTINCLVKRIKKGKLWLEIAGKKTEKPAFKAGKVYDFRIVDERTEPDTKTHYFILKDDDGHKHLLNKKFYTRYGLNTGDVVSFIAYHNDADGQLLLEPKHPCYETGKNYEFAFDRLEEMIFSDGYSQKILVLHDCFGEEIKLHTEEDLASQLVGKRAVQAVVKRIHKGRPELELTSDQPI